ncbi:MAG: cation diffusion facilitator family transporter [Hyphomicrobium sp.]|jgi:cobalt-zinc-cadmium efflux system protein|uniref:cation diffusion facilitator family transporter n=1 Tax=Hyphomicrobium sp. TaxID=82 RepID=UPI0025C5FB0E|nr:cation diffusion facilitator family transporter [Hyphomicrobium sp.]MBX9864396.1 cation diffusion facilitator family transporter [Hyphomicrobium sp.]
MGAGHDHGAGSANASALTKALALTGIFLIAEVVGALLTGSLALLSDAAHMMTDTAGLAIALAAVRIGARPADSKRTFGYKRFEILAAAVNALLLFVVAGYILYEGIQRFVEPAEIQSLPMLAIAVLGLVVNLISMRILDAGRSSSLNVKGAYLEVWSDMLGSVGVIIAALIIWATGWTWVDPLVAIAIGVWVLPRTWVLFKETTNILLEGVPEGIDLDSVTARISSTPGVASIHDLHVWALTSGMPSMSAHIVLAEGADQDATRVAVTDAMHDTFEITHVTLQVERADCRSGREHHGLH